MFVKRLISGIVLIFGLGFSFAYGGYLLSAVLMIISLIGAYGFRVLWIFTFFQANHTLQNLYISYPVSWAITALAHIVCFMIVRRRLTSASISA